MKLIIVIIFLIPGLLAANVRRAMLAQGNKPLRSASVVLSNPDYLTADLVDYWVSPSGSSGNDGSQGSPWDLQSVIDGTQEPLSDINTTGASENKIFIAIQAGTYSHPDRGPDELGYAVENLSGTAAIPVVLRNYNDGRATLDGGLHFPGSTADYVWVWGLEVIVQEFIDETVSQAPDDRYLAESGSNPLTLWSDGHLNVIGGTGIKLINNIVRDCKQGIAAWSSADGNFEAHGNISYDNGWYSDDRYHGPGMYTQNYQSGVGDRKYITGNILLDNYSNPLQATGSTSAYVEDYLIQDNIFKPRENADRATVVLGGQRASTLAPFDYDANISYGADIDVGYVDGGDEFNLTDNIVIEDSDFIGGTYSYQTFTNLTDTGNSSNGKRFNTEGWSSGVYSTGDLSGQGVSTETRDSLVTDSNVANTWSGTTGAQSPQIIDVGGGNLVLELDSSRTVDVVSRDITDFTSPIAGMRDGAASMVLNVSTIPSVANPICQLTRNPDSGGSAAVTVAIRPSSGGTKYQVGVSTENVVANATYAAQELDPDTDYVVLWHWDYSDQTVDLWVDPLVTEANASDAQDNTGALDENRQINFYQRGGLNEAFDNSFVLTVDSLIVGHGFLDVWQSDSIENNVVSKVAVNKYESGRANIAIWQPGAVQSTVEVDGSFLLKRWVLDPVTGDQIPLPDLTSATYEILDPKDFYGTPIATGTFSGSTVSVPTGSAEFVVYVVRRT